MGQQKSPPSKTDVNTFFAFHSPALNLFGTHKPTGSIVPFQHQDTVSGPAPVERKRLTNYTGDDVGIVADAFRLAQAAGVSSGPQFCSKRHRQFREGPYPFARASAPKCCAIESTPSGLLW
jgi:hypothetical protein